jgi:hypothetical protein
MDAGGTSTSDPRRTASRALGFYWGAVATALLFAAPLAPRAAALLPQCAFRSLTGLPCPTCGATHAALALSRLDLAGAVSSNPLAVAGAAAFVAGGILAGILALAGRPLSEPTLGPRARLTAIAAVVLNWIWLLAR